MPYLENEDSFQDISEIRKFDASQKLSNGQID